MPPLYDQTGYDNSDEDFIGSKIKGWQSGNRHDALDLADFYAAQGDEEQASLWARLADDTDILLGHLHRGLALIETVPARAAQHLIAAFNGLRTEAIAPLHQLLQLNSAERLRMPPDEHSRVFVQLQEILKRKAAIELRTPLLTGTRPVLFQKIPGPATYDKQGGYYWATFAASIWKLLKRLNPLSGTDASGFFSSACLTFIIA
jgi:hypothetical protein